MPGLLVLLTVQLSAKATWIEVQRQPRVPPLVAGEVMPPSSQPVVALWNHRGDVDIFGRVIPAQIVYDTELAGVFVNATLLAAETGEPREILGRSLLLTSCGRAQYTNLQVQKAGWYTLRFSAFYFSSTETTNSSQPFQVPMLPSPLC